MTQPLMATRSRELLDKVNLPATSIRCQFGLRNPKRCVAGD